MIDLSCAAFLALIALGTGKRLLDRLGRAPDRPLDLFALALPLGLGLTALGVLALGEFGVLNRVGLAALLAIETEFGLRPAWRWGRAALSAVFARGDGGQGERQGAFADRAIALCLGAALIGTALVALAPVTDGDALCYHLQVPRVFLARGAVGFDPDLHETVYPLVTELLYLPALAFRGPVACRWIQWALGLALFANVAALARPALGRRAWWAGAIVLLAPAVSNGMSAPLNDVALAAMGAAALFAWTRLIDRPDRRSALVAGAFAGLAIGVKYPALVLVAVLAAATAARGLLDIDTPPWKRPARRAARPDGRPRLPLLFWPGLTALYLAATVAVGGCWYWRAYLYTGNPVYPFFRGAFGGAGLDEVLAPIKRPMAVNLWNLLTALVPLSLQPDRFDSFSHQFGPVFLLFFPAALLERPNRRLLGLAAIGQCFLMLCLTQRQSMRFVLIALAPMAVVVAYGASAWAARRTVPARALLAVLIAALMFEAGWAVARDRHVFGLLTGRETAESWLARHEPTYVVGRWAARNLPETARLIGQDHRGFYIPRPYTMELAHRRRTGLGRRGEPAGEIVRRLRSEGFTHVLLCPPVPETAVEFDPALGRLLAAWLAGRVPIYRQDLIDGDGVLRRYAIYDLTAERLAVGPSPERGPGR